VENVVQTLLGKSIYKQSRSCLSDEPTQKVTDIADNVKDQVTEAAEGLIPQIQIRQGKKINKKGKILDEEGDVIVSGC
jgi:hypothetical protein